MRARNAANLRRRDDAGRSEEMDDSCAEASGGITGSAASFPRASSFRRFRRRCGSSSDCEAIDSTASFEEGITGEVELVELGELADNEPKTPSLLIEPSAVRF